MIFWIFAIIFVAWGFGFWLGYLIGKYEGKKNG
jgi:hypothetical protein